jgi:hypothetical protein
MRDRSCIRVASRPYASGGAKLYRTVGYPAELRGAVKNPMEEKMSTDPDEQSGSGSGSFFPIILAIVISVIVLLLVVPNTRRHASSMDEGTPLAAAKTAPAPAAAPAKPTTTP